MKTQILKKHLTLLAILLLITSAADAGNRLMAWGFNNYGQCDVPEGNNYTSVVCGSYHNTALTNDGSIVSWGINNYGQSEAPLGSGYKAVAAKGHWNVAISANGQLVAWGKNDLGQCDVPPGNDYKAVAAGVRHGLALKNNGTVVAWGNNDYGQCDVVQGSFTDIAAGLYSSFAIRSDGTVQAWGTNAYGLLDVSGITVNSAISTGLYHNVALDSDGSLISWGNNIYGQFNMPDIKYRKAAAGVYHTMAIPAEGGLECAGMDFYGQCVIPDQQHDYIDIACGDFHNVAIYKEPIVEIDIKIVPNALRDRFRFGWVLCKIKSDDSYDISQIDGESLKFNGEIDHLRYLYSNRRKVAYVIFSKSKVINSLQEGINEIVLSGKFKDGTELEGYQNIKLIKPEPRRSWLRRFLRYRSRYSRR